MGRQLFRQIALSVVMFAAIEAHAQGAPQATSDGSAPGGAATSSSPSLEMTDGEVRKVDRDTGRITIRHGEIKHLEMPPMTMVFRVKDTSLLDKAKEGEKVRFVAERINGAMTVTSLERAN